MGRRDLPDRLPDAGDLRRNGTGSSPNRRRRWNTNSRSACRSMRGVAFAAKQRWAEANAALDSVGRIASAFPKGDNKTALLIAERALEGEIDMRRGSISAAVRSFQSAVILEDGHPTTSLPSGITRCATHSAKRLSCGAVCEAEEVYRRDLERFPENGWSLVRTRASAQRSRTAARRRSGARPVQPRVGEGGHQDRWIASLKSRSSSLRPHSMQHRLSPLAIWVVTAHWRSDDMGASRHRDCTARHRSPRTACATDLARGFLLLSRRRQRVRRFRLDRPLCSSIVSASNAAPAMALRRQSTDSSPERRADVSQAVHGSCYLTMTCVSRRRSSGCVIFERQLDALVAGKH